MHFNTITIDTDGKAAFTALVADRAGRGGPQPALILLHEIFGLNGAMRDTARLFAEEGYLVVAPELFWRIEPGVDLGYGEAEVAKAMTLYGQYNPVKGLGDIAPSGRSRTETAELQRIGRCAGILLRRHAGGDGIDDEGRSGRCRLLSGRAGQGRTTSGRRRAPVVMHFGAADPYCPPEALAAIRARFADQPAQDLRICGRQPCLYNAERPEYAPGAAKVSHTRSLQLLRKQVGAGLRPGSAMGAALLFEFGLRDADRTIGTMVEEPYVNHVPTLTGGVGRKELRHFYKNFFVDVILIQKTSK